MNSTQVPGTTELGGPPPEEIQKQLNKIIHSRTFRHASALQRLLQYLINRAVEDPFAEIKEYTIGVDVFDRGADYDPQSDTIVRVQIHRLRLKVKEYYDSEGANDPIIVEIPKGHYVPSFEMRPPKTTVVEEPTETAPSPRLETEGGHAVEPPIIQQPHEAADRTLRSIAPLAVLIPAVLIIFVLGAFLGTRWPQSKIATSSRAQSEDAATAFWKSFLGNDSAPVVGYADAVYLVDGAEDLFRFRRGASDNTGTVVDSHLAQQFASSPGLVAKAGPLYYEDGNTGTGDLESVFVLTRLFTQMGLQMTVKRCRLITIDDLQQHDVILLGSPEENDAVAQLSQPSDFVWNRLDVAGPWKGEYINQHPQPGESLTYKTERDPNTQEVKTDFGLITIQPGAVPGRYIAILGGLDTSGVAGTAQFITSPSQMALLQARLESLHAWPTHGGPISFQAVLRVDVERGNDVFDVHLVTVHVTGAEKAAGAPVPNSKS
jgi:hypothetical protein